MTTIIELPILFPTDEFMDNASLGIRTKVNVEEKPKMTTFYVPDTAVITVNEGELSKISHLAIDDIAYFVDADYETLNQVVQTAIKKAANVMRED